ncbi:MAG: hypothetical protein ABIC19_00715 [Patescibacteria group bacterium]|nr:hypothetical protein [Patescibacteria group bacterium]
MEENTTAGGTPEMSQPNAGQLGAVNEPTFDEKMDRIRVSIKDVGGFVLRTKEQKIEADKVVGQDVENTGEVIANLMLAYRHLEDASMRIGKVKQARNGGVSVYDKNVVGSPE